IDEESRGTKRSPIHRPLSVGDQLRLHGRSTGCVYQPFGVEPRLGEGGRSGKLGIATTRTRARQRRSCPAAQPAYRVSVRKCPSRHQLTAGEIVHVNDGKTAV